jgi:chaperonin GroES
MMRDEGSMGGYPVVISAKGLCLVASGSAFDQERDDTTMADASSNTSNSNAIETIEPVGMRVLIRKDQDKKVTKVGIHLPDTIEIPTITGRVIAVSRQVDLDEDYPVEQYDRVLFNPKTAIPVDFEGDNRLFVVPVEDVVAIFRRDS